MHMVTLFLLNLITIHTNKKNHKTHREILQFTEKKKRKERYIVNLTERQIDKDIQTNAENYRFIETKKKYKLRELLPAGRNVCNGRNEL